jgi:hypothetical protein
VEKEMENTSLEITTQIGCSVNCLKYCPQELITSRYKGERHLSLEAFKQFINDVPPEVIIRFCGFAEPFLNQECPDMIIWAHNKGHEIIIYSTLVGLTPVDADRILYIPFKEFVLHLPDAEGNAHIPITQDYLTVLGKVLTSVHNISFMNMGPALITNNCENMARGLVTKRKSGRVYCSFHNTINYSALPNGDVFFCCVTRGLSEKIGSLYENTHTELASPEMFAAESYRMQTDPNSLCHICTFAYPYWFTYLERAKSFLLGDEIKIKDSIKKWVG